MLCAICKDVRHDLRPVSNRPPLADRGFIMQTPRLMFAIFAAAGLSAAIAGCGGGGGSSGGQTTTCGNSKLDAGENCDDGNSSANDGCSVTCQVESGWSCYTLGAPCVAAGCSDG